MKPGALTTLARSRRARWLYIAHRVLQRLSGGRAALHAYVFCAQPFGAGNPYRALRDDPRTQVLAVPPLHPLTACFPRPPQVVQARFASGAECHAVTVDGTFAGHLWLAHGFYEEDEVRCRYALPAAPACVWDYDVFIEPRFRAGRALGRLWKAVDAVQHAKGTAWTCSRISLFNGSSLQAHERLGAQGMGAAAFLVLGPLQMALFTQAPWLHASLTQQHRPVLRLRPPAHPAAATTGDP